MRGSDGSLPSPSQLSSGDEQPSDGDEQPSDGDEQPSDGDDLRAAAAEWLHTATSGLRHVVDLAAAEAQLAVMSGLSMVVMMAMVAAALVVAWLLVMGMVGVGLVATGVPLLLAGLILTVAQLLLAFGLWRATVKLSRNLTLPELRRTVMSTDRSRGGS